MSPAAKRFEHLIYEQRLVHDGSPVLRWNIECCEIASDLAGNIKPVHPERHRETTRNDLVIACVMATGMSTISKPKDRSVYEDRMPITLGW